MLILTKKGLYCRAGDFYIDPSGAVDRAVVTHAHSDHARKGSKQYYSTKSGTGLLKARLGAHISVQSYSYSEAFQIGGVQISFHPAGHILGSSQVRLEVGGEVWVVSGDYKRDFDPTCEPFETVTCDVFITEGTFATPAYRWPKNQNLGEQIFDWWQGNRKKDINSILFAYTLGKTQRILGLLKDFAERPIYCHSSANALNECYIKEGIELAPYVCLSEVNRPLRGELLLVPQAFLKTSQSQILGEDFKTAFASGWMAKDFGNYDTGFTISDHADWDDLVQSIIETRARRVYVQHRNGAMVRYLRTLGISAFSDADLMPENPQQLAFF